MKTGLLLLIAMALIGLPGIAGCTSRDGREPQPTQTAEETGPRSVVDLVGREVVVPASVDRVVAIGPGALRLVVYAGGADMVVGIEDIESKPPVARPYTLANSELLDLPVVGAGGPDSAPDAERLLSVDPDVIFIAQIADASGAEELAAATGIPVVVVSYGSLGGVDEPFFESLQIVGQVLGTQEHALGVTGRIREAISDLESRTAHIAEDDKPGAFIGALGFKGLHGLESTQADYLPFVAVGANNVASEIGRSGSVMIDKEKLLEWNPEYIFVDRSGLALVREDVRSNASLYRSLSAVQAGGVYAQLPFNNYWTNVELALADAYYAGKVLFPAQFSDIDPAAITDELAVTLVGGPVYDRLTEVYGGGFGPVDLLTEE